MGYIRISTYKAAEHLVKALWRAGTMHELIEDGGDIFTFKTPKGSTVSVHFIESSLPVYEIRNTLEYNQKRGHYTLFMLWSRMMLPHHAQVYEPEDWMAALLKLYGDRIYGYDVFEGEVFLFPVNFRGEHLRRYVEYGTTINPEQLTLREIETTLPGLEGTWRIADMNGTGQDANRQRMNVDELSTLDEKYVLLGVTPSDDIDTIKKAYRLLARRYHPDTNTSAEAHDMMQKINNAYQQIMKSLE